MCAVREVQCCEVELPPGLTIPFFCSKRACFHSTWPCDSVDRLEPFAAIAAIKAAVSCTRRNMMFATSHVTEQGAGRGFDDVQ